MWKLLPCPKLLARASARIKQPLLHNGFQYLELNDATTLFLWRFVYKKVTLLSRKPPNLSFFFLSRDNDVAKWKQADFAENNKHRAAAKTLLKFSREKKSI